MAVSVTDTVLSLLGAQCLLSVSAVFSLGHVNLMLRHGRMIGCSDIIAISQPLNA